MKKLVYGLLAVMVCVGSAHAKTHSNKTFLMPRSHNENLAMEYTTWHKQVRHIDEDKWGGTFQLTGFYQASTNKSDIGKYFGKYNNATGPNSTNAYAGTFQDFIWVKDRPTPPSATNNEELLLLGPCHIIHDYNKEIDGTTLKKLHEKAVMRPKQTSYGIRLDYHQKLDKLTKGLFFKVTAPIVYVKNDMNVCHAGDVLKQRIPDGSSTGTVYSFADYLAGKVENKLTTDIQKKLTHAKIPCDSDNSTTGVADVDVTLGYNFLYKEHKHFGANVCLTVPTNDTTDGVSLFDPVLGLGGHWAIGCGVDGAFELWKQDNKNLEFLMAVNYKYVLNETEKRTVGFKYPIDIINDGYKVAGKRVGFGHYMLGGKIDEKGVFPLANVLTRDVGVEPGSMVEGLMSFAFNWGNATFDLGYNFFAKEAENVTIKSWADGTYAVAAFDYNTTSAFAVGNIQDVDSSSGANQCIKKSDLLPQDAATPVYVTHKVFGGVGYAYKSWDYPIMFGAGGSWEWEQGSNSALDGWGLWLKAGMTF